MTVVSFGEGARLEGFFQAGENFRDFQDDRAEDASALDEGPEARSGSGRLQPAQCSLCDPVRWRIHWPGPRGPGSAGRRIGRRCSLSPPGGAPAFRSGRSRWPSAQQGLRPRALPPELRSLRQRGCRGGSTASCAMASRCRCPAPTPRAADLNAFRRAITGSKSPMSPSSPNAPLRVAGRERPRGAPSCSTTAARPSRMSWARIAFWWSISRAKRTTWPRCWRRRGCPWGLSRSKITAWTCFICAATRRWFSSTRPS
jgi:hypothetical protein